MTDQTSERAQHLWLLAVSPTIWMAHFLASYVTSAVWCARAGRGAELGGVRIAVVFLTVAALAGILVVGWRGLRRLQLGSTDVSRDTATGTASHADTEADRHRFIGLATLLLSGLSLVAVIYSSLNAAFFGACY